MWSRTIALAAAAFALLPQDARAFGTPEPITDAAGSRGPVAAALGQDGTVAVAYRTANQLAVRVRSPAGTWGGAQTVSTDGAGAAYNRPGVAIGADGTISVVWLESATPNTGVRGAIRPAGSSGFTTFQLAPGGMGQASPAAPSTAVTADGSAVYSWQSNQNPSAKLQVRVRAGGSLGDPLEAASNAADSSAAILPDGRVGVAWLDTTNSLNRLAKVTPIGLSGTTATAAGVITLSEPGANVTTLGEFAGAAAAYVDAAGVHAVRIRAALTTRRSDLDATAFGGRPAVGRNGDTTAVVWQDKDHHVVAATASGDDGAFGGVSALANSTTGALRVAVAGDGTAVAAWPAFDTATRAFASIRRPGDSFDPAVAISGADGAINSDGVAVTAGTGDRLFAAFSLAGSNRLFGRAQGAFPTADPPAVTPGPATGATPAAPTPTGAAAPTPAKGPGFVFNGAAGGGTPASNPLAGPTRPGKPARPTAPALHRTGITRRTGTRVNTGLSLRCPLRGHVCTAQLTAPGFHARTLRIRQGGRAPVALRLTRRGAARLRKHRRLQVFVTCRGVNGRRSGYSALRITVH